MAVRNLIFILGDQLSHSISSLKNADPDQDTILMTEVKEEATYVKHHKKKIAFILSAMRHFADELKNKGFQVRYTKMDDADNKGSFIAELDRATGELEPKGIVVTEPSEYRVSKMFDDYKEQSNLAVEIIPDTRFIATHEEFREWAKDRKTLRMEYFYREMRRKTGLLMNDDEPEGDKWNYDSENRKPADDDMFIPKPPAFEPDDITSDVINMVAEKFSDHFGDLDNFWFAVTAEQAEEAVSYFIENALQDFGQYQDAMLLGQKYLYHSVLSQYINVGLLDALDVCKHVEKAYKNNKAPLNSVEGFIRQIIGWREYIRGIYWLKMPDYENNNFFENERKLPSFYWDGKTDMKCLSEAIKQTKEEAYAHHIQRLMITGNFALLIGANPRDVHEWYLTVYADAFEWVEMPNTIGMSQFADGGLLGSKPYISSGNYISKMSNYCQECSYAVTKKTGDNACPFNSLYWHFLKRNEDKLGDNPRLGNVYRVWSKMSEEKQKAHIEQADAFLEKLS